MEQQIIESPLTLYFPKLSFELLPSERALLTPKVRHQKARNISLDASGHLKDTAGDTATQLALALMIGRFREQALALIHSLLPDYKEYLRLAPTSYRPMQVESRAQ